MASRWPTYFEPFLLVKRRRETTFYVSDERQKKTYAADVRDDGSLTKLRLFGKSGWRECLQWGLMERSISQLVRSTSIVPMVRPRERSMYLRDLSVLSSGARDRRNAIHPCTDITVFGDSSRRGQIRELPPAEAEASDPKIW